MVSIPNETPHVQRIRVNGASMSANHGKPVCLLGTVLKADGGGVSFQVRSSDGQQINIRSKQPLTEPLQGLIEIYGLGQGKNLIVADAVTTFPAEMLSIFDMPAYNEYVNLISNTDTNNPWKPQ